MSTAPEPYVRHPLGLPPGSVRATLAVMITGLFVILVLLPAEKAEKVPLFLYFLMSLLLVFVTAHGQSIGAEANRHPFGMPKGFFRFLVVAAVLASVGWRFSVDREQLLARLTPSADQLKEWPYLCAGLFGGFLVGRLLRLGPWRHRPMFQDSLATLSLVCMMGLGVYTLALLFIRPSLPQGLDLKMLESGLTAAIALYFGTRS